MKSKDMQTLKEMSQEVVDLIPCGLMVDGNKNVYLKGKPESIINVVMLIEKARIKATELNDTIKVLKGRKSSNK